MARQLFCDSCGEWTDENDWWETEVACDDCGSHPAIVCPTCEEVFDGVFVELTNVRWLDEQA